MIYGARDFSAGKLCPWVLGINGSNRLTNAIDQAQVHYHDSIVVAQSWAALSTDAGRGVRLLGERLFSGIGRLTLARLVLPPATLPASTMALLLSFWLPVRLLRSTA